ncbi:MAG: helix-hairpin-helix domain-containing protein [Rhodoferax sp.]|uniref:ComEA family DNA-binding protein n=1 Tax=Rhodoferax sp. TaxID=50421 RepID=UPI00262F9198|nr:helix-hairpin-helix domain-containing protein [Rhodoferax sp.]MDD5336827.1 helix-hairpin-helix domain-containing protein [Rhodoferax sp.]
MFKKLLAFFAAMFLVAAFAAVDVNKATEAELDGIKGIGPVTTKQIISERKKGEFKSWDDFVTRVKGVGDKNAAKFSAEGLTVSGAKYQGPSAAPAKKADKPLTEKAKDAAVSTKDAIKGAAISTKDAVKETAKDVKKAVTPKADAAKPAASAAKK